MAAMPLSIRILSFLFIYLFIPPSLARGRTAMTGVEWEIYLVKELDGRITMH
jgi:hypothetical protein